MDKRSGGEMPTLDEVLDELERRGVVNPTFGRHNDRRYWCAEPDVDGYGWCMGEPFGEGSTRVEAALALLGAIS